MFEDTEELLRKIRLGEDTSLEFKAVFFNGKKISGPARKDLAAEIAAMANTCDGVLLLGVDDKKKIVGIPRDRLDDVDRYVSDICEQSIRPPVRYKIFRLELPDTVKLLKPILKVEIPCSLFVHETKEGYFHRQGSSKRRMPSGELSHLLRKRRLTGMFRFEESPIPRSDMDNLSEKLWRKYSGSGKESPETVLLKRGLLSKEENGPVRVSVAGILLCCEEPERFLPSAMIRAVRYRGIKRDGNYQIDAQEICGPLERQIQQSMAFLKRNQTVMATKEPHRIEQAQFSERAVFEAIVNAVVHRDYSIAGSSIRFFMFDDRLEIYSPGALPNTVTVDGMRLRQVTRNELVTSLLAQTAVAETVGDVSRQFYVEKRGEGVPIILDKSEELSGKQPEYQLIDDSELLLTIYSKSMERAGPSLP